MQRVAILVENSRAYGRAIIEGVAAFAQEERDWILRPLARTDAVASKLKGFDGVIARIADDRLAARLRRLGLPTVDVFCQKPQAGILGVDSDHAAIGKMARDFFRTRGFKNLAFCGLPGVAFSDARERAFSDAQTFVYSREAICPTDESQFYGERIDRIPDARQLRTWVKDLPTPIAVFCCNDLRAIQLQQIVRECGFCVPQDFALLGVDNDTIACSYAEVPISSIDPNAVEVGYEAAHLLHALMSEGKGGRGERFRAVKPAAIIERASSEFMPVDPPWLGEALMYIERNMRRPITAREIFALSHRSSTLVENVFRARLGKSVQMYITAVKMREARRLLANPALRISEVADLCGFASPQYFCRTFTAVSGVNPRAYRASLSR